MFEIVNILYHSRLKLQFNIFEKISIKWTFQKILLFLLSKNNLQFGYITCGLKSAYAQISIRRPHINECHHRREITESI